VPADVAVLVFAERRQHAERHEHAGEFVAGVHHWAGHGVDTGDVLTRGLEDLAAAQRVDLFEVPGGVGRGRCRHLRQSGGEQPLALLVIGEGDDPLAVGDRRDREPIPHGDAHAGGRWRLDLGHVHHPVVAGTLDERCGEAGVPRDRCEQRARPVEHIEPLLGPHPDHDRVLAEPVAAGLVVVGEQVVPLQGAQDAQAGRLGDVQVGGDLGERALTGSVAAEQLEHPGGEVRPGRVIAGLCHI